MVQLPRLRKTWIPVFCMITVLVIIAITGKNHIFLDDSNAGSLCGKNPIDAVYTWVNGSDPDFNILKIKYAKEGFVTVNSASKRFKDWGTLKYSLRSVEKYAPWIRNIYLVTNGQVPDWMNLKEDGIKLMTHQDIFEDTADLPTFNADAIELYLHKIPGLSDKFLFFNDDMLLGHHLYKEDLCHGLNGQKIYFSHTRADHCVNGCTNDWLGDGICQLACNVSTCLHDKGDCLPGSDARIDKEAFRTGYTNTWKRTLIKWNIIFNDDFGYDDRFYPMHQAMLFDKRIKEDFNNKYKDEVNHTAKNRFRSPTDVQFHFTYAYYLIGTSSKLMEAVGTIPRYEYVTLRDKGLNEFVNIKNDPHKTSDSLYKAARWGLPKFLCIQDDTDDDLDPEVVNRLQTIVTEYLELNYPDKSRFEI